MAYIGRQLVRGQNRVLDDISGSFNGSTTAFNLTVSSSSSPPASVNQLWIILGGVLQKPGTDFTVADAVITFTTAPASTLSFWGMIQGDTSDINSPADASVTPSKIANSGDFAFPADVRFKDADASHYVGLQAPSTVSSNLVWTLPAADGSANQVLKTDGSGALGWASDANAPEGTAVLSTGETGTTKYLRVDGDNTCSWQLAVDATKMPLAGGSFTGDVVFTGDAANVTWDKSTDDLIFNDNAKAIFGTSSDGVEIYHDASHSYINNTGTGNLYIVNDNGGTINLQTNGAENAVKCIENGAVELYYDNVKKVGTESYGIQLHDATAPEIRLLRTGNSGYAKIYADAANKLYLSADHTAASADSKVAIVVDGTERAYWDSEYYIKNGSIVFQTADKGVCLGSTTLNAANTLTDYEEGTWTPAIYSGGWSLSSTNKANYTKIGERVFITLYIGLGGSGNSSHLVLNGLPFTSESNGYNTGIVDFGLGGKKGAYMRTYSSDTALSFYYSSESPSTSRPQIIGTDVGAGYIICTISYKVA